jgi:F0F1-type ATP synthase epsilon subunit
LSADFTLALKILTPEGLLLEADQLTEVIVPLADGGTIGIRAKHAALIAETVDGPVRFLKPGSDNEIALLAGVLQIREDTVSILTAGSLEEESPPVSQDQTITYTRLVQTLIASLENEQTVEEVV